MVCSENSSDFNKSIILLHFKPNLRLTHPSPCRGVFLLVLNTFYFHHCRQAALHFFPEYLDYHFLLFSVPPCLVETLFVLGLCFVSLFKIIKVTSLKRPPEKEPSNPWFRG